MSASLIQLVYPKIPTDAATPLRIYEASTFLLGQLKPPASSLQVNEESVTLGPKGYFAHKVPLRDGLNTFVLNSDAGEALTLSIERPALLEPLPGQFHSDCLPLQKPCVLSEGSTLPLHCLAPQGTVSVKAYLYSASSPDISITEATLLPDMLTQQVPESSQEAALFDNREAVFGALHQAASRISREASFSGQLLITSSSAAGLRDEASLVLRLEAKNPSEAVLAHWESSPDKLTFWKEPRLGIITRTVSLSRCLPHESGARNAPPQKGMMMPVFARQEGYYQVAYGESVRVWIPEDHMTLQGQGRLAPVRMQLVRLRQRNANRWQVQIPLPRFVPTLVWADPYRLTLSLYGVSDACNAIQLQPNESPFLGVYMESMPEDWVRLHIELERPLSGYDLRWQPDGSVVLELQLFPMEASQWVIMLDPGHGGEEFGAIGLDGTPEKTLNLEFALQLRQALKAAGFARVQLTRHFDETVSLEERARRVKEARAHVCVSLHHNALPDGRDPWKEQGACSFYFHDFARPLAYALQQDLVQHARRHDAGLYYGSFAMTRIHTATAALVELGFLIHPEEYADLQQASTRKALMQAIVEALEHFQTSVIEHLMVD